MATILNVPNAVQWMIPRATRRALADSDEASADSGEDLADSDGASAALAEDLVDSVSHSGEDVSASFKQKDSFLASSPLKRILFKCDRLENLL